MAKKTTQTRNSNREGSIFKRANGDWCAKIQYGVKPNGKPYIKTFTSSDHSTKGRAVVSKKLDDFKALIRANPEIVAKAEYNKKQITVQEYILKWLATVKINDLKPTSYDRLESTVNNHIVSNIGHLNLLEVTPEQIQELVINKMQNGKNPSSRSSIKKAYDAINACYKYALASRMIEYNPVTAVVLPAIHKFEKKEIRAFTNDEKERFKKACTYTYNNGVLKYKLGYGMIFIMNTGIRAGEAIALKWSDVNWSKKELDISKNVVETKHRNGKNKGKKLVVIQDFVKSQAGHRTVPLNKTAIECLKKIKEDRYYGEDSFILSNQYGKMNTLSNTRRMFNEIAEFAEIKNCGMHTLRHTFASTMFENNVDVKTVSEILGHSTTGITYDTYIHIIKEQKAKVMETLDEI